MAELLGEWVLAFAFYSFLGWLCESVYCSIPAKRFINRGFLNGPFCPVYGVGALLVIFSLRPFAENAVLIFLFGMLLTTILEYLTSLLLERLFHTKWWDYSSKRFQLHGRVCLKNSLLFGLLCVILMLLIHPLEQRVAARIPVWLMPYLGAGVLIYFAGDTAVSVHTILQLNGKLKQIHLLFVEIENKKLQAKHRLQSSIEQKMEEDIKEKLEHLLQKKKELEKNSKLLQRRLISAFPNMHSMRHPEHFLRIRQGIEDRRARRKAKK